MTSTDPDSCTICSQQPQQMLILTCQHHLCLDCATELFIASRTPSSLQCEICTATTSLDTETVQCLSVLACEQRQLHPPPPTTPPALPRPSSDSHPNDYSNNKALICPQHNEEGLYFCFDCNHARICSECILEQTHLHHHILTIKKSLPLLVEQLNSHVAHLKQTEQSLVEEKQRLQRSKQEEDRAHEERMGGFKEVFDDIVRQVNSRYSQLSHEISQLHQRNTEMFEGRLKQVNSQLTFIQQTIEQQSRIVDKDRPVDTVINYCKSQHQRTQSFQELSPETISFTPMQLIVPVHTNTDIAEVIGKIAWQQQEVEDEQQEGHDHKQNHYKLTNQGSIEMLRGPSCRKVHWQPTDQHPLPNRSIDNYSGIKDTSRRLELSRSMHNATNIINRLQTRVRRGD